MPSVRESAQPRRSLVRSTVGSTPSAIAVIGSSSKLGALATTTSSQLTEGGCAASPSNRRRRSSGWSSATTWTDAATVAGSIEHGRQVVGVGVPGGGRLGGQQGAEGGAARTVLDLPAEGGDPIAEGIGAVPVA